MNLGEIVIAGSSRMGRVDLYNLYLQIQHPGQNKKLIDSSSEFTQSEFDNPLIHKHINAERYLEQLSWAFEKNDLLKVKVLLELKKKVTIDGAGYENILSTIDSIFQDIASTSTSHLKSNPNFYSLNEKTILLAFIRNEIDSVNTQKSAVINKLTYIKNKHTQHKIRLRTSEQLLLYKSVFDIYKSLIFQGKSEGFIEGLFLFYSATYLLPKGNQLILTYSKGRIPFRKYAGGLLLAAPDIYGLSTTISSIFKGDTAAFSFDARNLYIDLSSTSTSVAATYRELIKNISNWKTGLVILGGTLFLKGFSKFGEDIVNYYLPIDESIYSALRGMLDILDSAPIEKHKKKQAYSNYMYEGLVGALNEDNDLVIAGVGMGALGNEVSSWEITDAYFEKMKSGKSKINRAMGQNTAPRKVGRPKRLVQSRRRPQKLSPEQVQESLERVNRIQEARHGEVVKKQEEGRPKPAKTFIDLSTFANKPVRLSASNAPEVLFFFSNYHPSDDISKALLPGAPLIGLIKKLSLFY
ncbi:MAG: hypothetical protein O7C59_06210 [Rickettsia endosymbiont of Ixodes persulcatus]|nr:hypothetical protein [Rickettsia endosymbiont of Ixodes persulcatus]